MWLITNFGMFSAVARKGKDLPEGDNRTLQIRARSVAHLDTLRERYMNDELGPNVTYKSSDYQVRAFCTPEAWGRAVYAASQDITYTNFKDSVKDDKLHTAAFKVWNAFADVYGTNYSWEKSGSTASFSGYTAYNANGTRKAGTRSFRIGDAYQSAFGEVDGDATVTGAGWPDTESRTLGYSLSTPSGAASKYDPFETEPEAGTEVEVFGSLVEDADVLDDWDDDNFLGGGDSRIAETQARINELLSKYIAPPEDLPDILTAREVKDHLRITNRLMREFLAGNPTWKKYKAKGGRYEFPKEKLLFMEEDFNIWHSEKLDREKAFSGV